MSRVVCVVRIVSSSSASPLLAPSAGRLVDEFVSPHVNSSFLTRRCGDGPASACCTHHDGPPGSPAHYDGTGVPPLCGAQLWVKPLSTSNGSVAVLVLNNQDLDVANVSITVALGAVLPAALNHSAASVYDVWADELLHPSVSGSFATDVFGGHDCRMYVVTPTKSLPEDDAVALASVGSGATAEQHMEKYEVVSSLAALTCEERCAGGSSGDQPGFMHCCVGLNSTGQVKSRRHAGYCHRACSGFTNARKSWKQHLIYQENLQIDSYAR